MLRLRNIWIYFFHHLLCSSSSWFSLSVPYSFSTGSTTLLSSLPFWFKSNQMYSCFGMVILHFFCYLYIVDIHNKLIVIPSSPLFWQRKVFGTCSLPAPFLLEHVLANLWVDAQNRALLCWARRLEGSCAFTDEGRQQELLIFIQTPSI